MSPTKHFSGPRFRPLLVVILLVAGLVTVAAPAQAEPLGAGAAAMAVTPNITNQPCTAARSSWVHVYSKNVGTFCLGFRGTYTFNNGNGRWVWRVTFGNNYGSMDFAFKGTDGGLIQDYINFDGGNPYANQEDCTYVGGCFLYTLTIDGWH